MHAMKRNGFSKWDLNKPSSSVIVMFCMSVIQSWVVLSRGVSGAHLESSVMWWRSELQKGHRTRQLWSC